MKMPDSVERLLEEARTAWRELPASYREAGSAWSQADPLVVYGELRRLHKSGRRFLEWGSGIGTITVMADLMGLSAWGIESDARLVEAARSLAQRLGSGATFACGSFVPAGSGPAQSDEYLTAGGPDGHAELGKRPDEFDVIYVYPAPWHVDYCLDLFRDRAAVGASLWCYTDTAGILITRKVAANACTPLAPA
jgi:hypothetical protein